jgi:hypothetical protein
LEIRKFGLTKKSGKIFRFENLFYRKGLVGWMNKGSGGAIKMIGSSTQNCRRFRHGVTTPFSLRQLVFAVVVTVKVVVVVVGLII